MDHDREPDGGRVSRVVHADREPDVHDRAVRARDPDSPELIVVMLTGLLKVTTIEVGAW